MLMRFHLAEHSVYICIGCIYIYVYVYICIYVFPMCVYIPSLCNISEVQASFSFALLMSLRAPPIITRFPRDVM